jgi:hypothetical protein
MSILPGKTAAPTDRQRAKNVACYPPKRVYDLQVDSSDIAPGPNPYSLEPSRSISIRMAVFHGGLAWRDHKTERANEQTTYRKNAL